MLVVLGKATLLEEQREGDVRGEDGEDDEARHDDMETRELFEGVLVVHVEEQRRAYHQPSGVPSQLRHQVFDRVLLLGGGEG